jgi:hypothetical protein
MIIVFSAAAVGMELKLAQHAKQAPDSQQEQVQQQIAWTLELEACMIPAALSTLISSHSSF